MGESTPPATIVSSMPELDVAEGVAHRVGGGGAAGGNDVAQTAETEAHGDFAGQRADGAGRDGIHAALLLMAGIEEPVLLFGEILAAAAGADNHADLAQFVARHGGGVEAGVCHRLGDAGHRQRHGARYVRPVLRVDVGRLVELVGHFARHLHERNRTGSKRVIRRTPLSPPRGLSKNARARSHWG